MKTIKNIALVFVSFAILLVSCSEDRMDEINIDRNNPADMDAQNLIPDLLLKSAFETTATDIAWYTTVYIEHAAGTWAQSGDADRRIAQNTASLFNNSWNSIYGVMNIAHTIIQKTDPVEGEEPDNYWVRGIGQIMMAYNLAVATDMWGEVPYTEAFQGMDNLNPSYERQSDLYPVIQQLLDDGIANMDRAERFFLGRDYLFGHLTAADNTEAWKRFAWSLKARFSLRLTNIDEAAAAQGALNAIPNAMQSAADQVLFDGGFAVALGQANPWGEFWWSRNHLSVSTTIFDLMDERSDPRMDAYFYSTDRADIAPIGVADQIQGVYAGSRYTTNWDAWEMPITMFTFQELKFIEAEASFRAGAADWQNVLREAVDASFEFHGVDGAEAYFGTEVLPRLIAGNELEEIMTQKYIALYDREAIEVYNDYRRTGYPEMMNPNNILVGFVHRFPYPVSEITSNPQNVPEINVHQDQVWWAGGSEN
jgi:hypothetical protein